MFGRFSKWLAIAFAAAVLAVGARVALSHDHHDQGCGGGHHGCGSATGAGCCDFCDVVNLGKLATLEGKVESVNFAADTGYPSITLTTDGGKQPTVLVAPLWFLKDHGFAVKEGDHLIVRAATAQIAQQNRNVAVELERSDGTRLKLRDDTGTPLWTKAGGCCHHR